MFVHMYRHMFVIYNIMTSSNMSINSVPKFNHIIYVHTYIYVYAEPSRGVYEVLDTSVVKEKRPKYFEKCYKLFNDRHDFASYKNNDFKIRIHDNIQH